MFWCLALRFLPPWSMKGRAYPPQDEERAFIGHPAVADISIFKLLLALDPRVLTIPVITRAE